MAATLIGIQACLAVNIMVTSPRDAAYTLALLAGLGLLYFAWKRVPGQRVADPGLENPPPDAILKPGGAADESKSPAVSRKK